VIPERLDGEVFTVRRYINQLTNTQCTVAIYTASQKNMPATLVLGITLVNIDRFSKFFMTQSSAPGRRWPFNLQNISHLSPYQVEYRWSNFSPSSKTVQLHPIIIETRCMSYSYNSQHTATSGHQTAPALPSTYHGHLYQVRTTLCSKKTCDHIFDDKLKSNCPFTKIFWHTYYQEYRPSTGIFSFPPHLFRAATLPWETVET